MKSGIGYNSDFCRISVPPALHSTYFRAFYGERSGFVFCIWHTLGVGDVHCSYQFRKRSQFSLFDSERLYIWYVGIPLWPQTRTSLSILCDISR